MRIRHLCLTYHPAIGGADLFVRRIAEAQAASGHDVEVHTTDLLEHVRFLKLPPDVPREELRNGVRVVRHRTFRLPRHVYPISPGILRAARGAGCDVLHAHSSGYFPADAALLARRRRGPVVLLSPYGARPGYWQGLRRRLDLWNRADAVLALSPFEARALEELGVEPERIRIVPGGVDFDRFDAARPNPYLFAPDEEGVLYVGRIASGKGVDLLAEAFARLARDRPSVRLALVGPDYGAKESAARRLAERGVATRARLYDAADEDDLPALYKAARVFVLPSRYEAFGLVLLEAMAAGVPIVATRAGAIPDLVEDGETGLLVPPEDAGALARAIGRLLDDADLARRLAEASRAKARAMRWDATARRVMEVVEEAAGRRRRVKPTAARPKEANSTR